MARRRSASSKRPSVNPREPRSRNQDGSPCWVLTTLAESIQTESMCSPAIVQLDRSPAPRVTNRPTIICRPRPPHFLLYPQILILRVECTPTGFRCKEVDSRDRAAIRRQDHSSAGSCTIVLSIVMAGGPASSPRPSVPGTAVGPLVAAGLVLSASSPAVIEP